MDILNQPTNTNDNTPPASSSEDIKNILEAILTEKNATDIVTIDLKGKSDMADYMIIASGNNTTHVGALSEHVSKALKAQHIFSNIEGRPVNEWVLVDSPYVIVHIFKPETRELYNLEKMWAQ